MSKATTFDPHHAPEERREGCRDDECPSGLQPNGRAAAGHVSHAGMALRLVVVDGVDRYQPWM